MKSVSFLLLTYLILLMAFPIHSMEDCSHHEHDHQEIPFGEEDPDCCPPFSFCKSCSHFINEKFNFLELEPPQPMYTIEEIDKIQVGYVSVEIPFWHPPQLA